MQIRNAKINEIWSKKQKEEIKEEMRNKTTIETQNWTKSIQDIKFESTDIENHDWVNIVHANFSLSGLNKDLIWRRLWVCLSSVLGFEKYEYFVYYSILADNGSNECTLENLLSNHLCHRSATFWSRWFVCTSSPHMVAFASIADNC